MIQQTRHRWRHILSGICICFTVSFVLFKTGIHAQECGNVEECRHKIEEYEAKLKDLYTQKTNLTQEVARMDTQINLTAVKIINTNHIIEKTTEEIDSLEGKIGSLDMSLDHLSKLLLQKITEGYKSKDITFFDLFLNSENASVFLGRAQYMRAAQKSDQKIAYQLQQAKFNYEEQKSLREKKKVELEELTTSLNKQKKDLDTQKEQKKSLIAQTQNDQKKYQQLLA